VNTTTLVLNAVSAQDAGSYDLLISRVSGGLEKSRTLSRSNVLTLLQPPVIKGLTDLLARPGQRVSFAPQVVSSGSATTSYKWFRGTTQIPNATAPTLVLEPPVVADSYSLEATDDNGTARATAVLTVADVLAVAPLPASLRVEARARVSLEAKATGAPADGLIRYQWRFNGTAIRGAVRPKFELSAAQIAHSGKYDVVVSNNYERVVSGACALQVNQPWRIETQPVRATTVNPGEPIRLTVALNRTDAVSFQWIQGVGRSSKALAGQNAPTLLLPAAKPTDAGVYALVVTTPTGRITSSLARVSVNLPVTIVQNPASPPVLRPGESLSLTVKATGTGPFAYQWLRNGVPVAGANGATFSLSAISAADAGDYQAGVTNMVSETPVLSSVATVNVVAAPLITRQPADLKLHQWSDKNETGALLPKTREESLRQGASLDLSVGVTGDASPDAVLGYQWRRNGVPIAGETRPSLSRDFLSVYDTGTFDVVVTQTLGKVLAGSVVSRPALVVVHERPVFTLAPASQTTALGGTATFRAVTAGTPPLAYAWRKAGSQAVLGTSDMLTLSGVEANSFGEYTLTVTGPEIFTGSVNSTKTVSATVKLEQGTFAGGSAFAVLPAAYVGIEKRAARLVARAADGYRIERWERLATAGTSLNAQVISASSTGALTLDGGTLVLAAPTADADSGTYRAVAVALSGEGDPVPSGWVSVYFNLEDPLYKAGFRADAVAVEALKNTQVVSAKEDGSATLRMYPIGEGLSFEWRKEGVGAPLANSNRTALTLRNLKKEDSGLYYGSVLIPTGTLENGNPGVVRRETIAYQLIVQPLAVIEKDPENQALLPGQTAVFSIQTVVTPDTRFQWFFQRASTTEWVALPGATAGAGSLSTCQVRDIREVDEGFYRVEVTNGAGTVSSAAARLVVRDPVQVRLLTTPGADSSGQVAINPGSLLTLRADIGTAVAAEELVGDEKNPPVYVFRRQKKNSRSYELLSSGTSGTYTLASVREEDDTFYTVSVEGKVNGQVTSLPVRVSVNDPVVFGSNPLKVMSLVKGESAAFGVVVAKGYRPQFQWYRRPLPGASSTAQEWQLIGGGTAATYAIASAGTLDSASYGVVLYNSVNDASGKSSSAPLRERVREIARVSVKGPPSARILGAPAGLVATQGGSLVVSAEVSDTAGGVVQFQWRKDGRLVSGGSGAAGSVLVLPASPALVTLMKPAVTSADAGQYELLVSNANGASLSEAPRLVSIAELPSIELLSRPQAVASSVNGTATFRVSAKANGPLKYQWQSLSTASTATWSNVGDDSPVLSVKALAEDNGTRFRVVLSLPSVDFTLPETPGAELRVSAPSDVKIVRQPLLVSGGRQLSVGLATGRLEAVAEDVSGGTTLVYRWRKDGEVPADTRAKTTGKATGTAVRGTDGKFVISYDLPTVDNASDGLYDLVVENGANFASSEALPLTVDPKILSLEVPALVSPGDDAKLEVKVAGSGAYTYQWYRNATERVGTSSPKLLISRATPASSGTYSVVVTSGANVSNTSAALPLVVARKVFIVDQPSSNGELKQGDSLTLKVKADGDGSIAYQWLKDGVPLPSAASDTFSVSSVTSEDAGLYQVRVSNAAGSAMSQLVEVKVKQPLSVTLPPTQQVDRGQSAILAPKVLPAPGASVVYAFRWFRNGVEIPGASSEQYRISPVTAADAGAYTVTVTNPQTNESVTSLPSELLVRMLPQIVVPPASLTVGGDVRTASFAVVVSSTLSVSYQWTRTRNGIENSVGSNSPYLKLTDLGESGSSSIKVTVTDAHGSASASARLTVGTASPKRENAGSVGVSQAYAYASYWIFWADALGTRRNGIYTTDSTRGGYWLIERKSTGTEADRVVTPGTSVWIWGDSEFPALDPYVDSWMPENQSVLDALDSESSDFSVLARGDSSNFAISGRVEPSGEAALYGAPAAMEGAYENDTFGRMEVNLAWDAGQVLYFDGNSDIESVKTQLKTMLAEELAKIQGE
jgi:hypothetical protein